MKIILEAADITAAMVAHIANMGFDLTGKEVATAFNAGRGDNNHTVTLDITNQVGIPTGPIPRGAGAVRTLTATVETTTETTSIADLISSEPEEVEEVEEKEPSDKVNLFANA